LKTLKTPKLGKIKIGNLMHGAIPSIKPKRNRKTMDNFKARLEDVNRLIEEANCIDEGGAEARAWWRKQKAIAKDTELYKPLMKAIGGKINIDRNKTSPENIYGSVTGLDGIKKLVSAVKNVAGVGLTGDSKIIEPKRDNDVYLFFGSKQKPPVLITYYYAFKGESKIKRGGDYVYDVEIFIS
jgi:hypothetical protein